MLKNSSLSSVEEKSFDEKKSFDENSSQELSLESLSEISGCGDFNLYSILSLFPHSTFTLKSGIDLMNEWNGENKNGRR